MEQKELFPFFSRLYFLEKWGLAPFFIRPHFLSEKVACPLFLFFLFCILYFLDYLEKSLGRIDS